MLQHNGLQFTWVVGKQITDSQLEECASLYGTHYGVYSESVSIPGVKPGASIKMSPKRMRALLSVDGAQAGLVHLEGKLVAYAFLVIGAVELGEVISWVTQLVVLGEVISWVTQLVVHTNYRNQKVANRLLHAAWGISDRFAWGLATANPYAVRALEAATRRSCDPDTILLHLETVKRFTHDRINYFKDRPFCVGQGVSVVDTQFFVSHADLAKKLETIQMSGKPWNLGTLEPGKEWLAVTFRSQPQRALSLGELEQLLDDQDSIVKEAYARMLLDSSHKWMKATVSEVDFIVAHLGIAPGATILDAGCGLGRHAIELARRGYNVVGVDFVRSLVDRANQSALETGVSERVKFVMGDLRAIAIDQQFDAGLCLYDVVGSFPQDADNSNVLLGVAKHLKPGGRLLMSVLNRGLVEAQARHRGTIRDNLSTLQQLKPSNTMQKTGEIFNPEFYFYDEKSGVVYRKEQFILDDNIPCELIVRDRRYFASELESLCRNSGILPSWTRHVRMGKWENDLTAQDPNAKEVLLLGNRT